MEKSIINPQRTKTHQKILRFFLIVTGIILYVVPGYFTGSYFEYLLKILGLLLFLPAVMNPFSIFGGNDKMILTDKFLRVTDEMTITRTVYWNKIDEAVLTRFAFQVFYNSGGGENFHIPYLKQEEFEQVRSKIIQKSEEHNFPIEEKPWWKIF